jgi:biotin carboxyl carrier protein
MSDGNSGKDTVDVLAPLAGVCYLQAAPEEPPYVSVGDEVKKKQVLALLETMKVFQKVKSPVKGKIVKINAENEKAMSDSEVMFVIEPN